MYYGLEAFIYNKDLKFNWNLDTREGTNLPIQPDCLIFYLSR